MRLAAPYLAYAYLTLVGWTSRLRWHGLEHVEAASRGGGFIYAFWHQRQAFFTWSHRGQGPSVLVSRSKDGEIIARTMALSGIAAVRGSSSRGGLAAARELVELLERGKRVGITPDGPRGPAGSVKEGVLFLALKSGRPIVPISNAVSRHVDLRSWDRFQVPLPLSRAVVVYGPPLFVREGDDLASKGRELKAALDRITDEADRLVGRARE